MPACSHCSGCPSLDLRQKFSDMETYGGSMVREKHNITRACLKNDTCSPGEAPALLRPGAGRAAVDNRIFIQNFLQPAGFLCDAGNHCPNFLL